MKGVTITICLENLRRRSFFFVVTLYLRSWVVRTPKSMQLSIYPRTCWYLRWVSISFCMNHRSSREGQYYHWSESVRIARQLSIESLLTGVRFRQHLGRRSYWEIWKERRWINLLYGRLSCSKRVWLVSRQDMRQHQKLGDMFRKLGVIWFGLPRATVLQQLYFRRSRLVIG